MDVANCVADEAAEHGGQAKGAVVAFDAEVYHMLIMRTKPGLTVASARPSMKRLSAMPAKLEQARKFPRGSLRIA